MPTQRVIAGKEVTEYDLKCPDCGEPMVLRPSRFGLFYGCTAFPKCRAAHGAHPWGAPLGTPANAEVKQARIRAHEAFDRLWEGGAMKRNDAYRWLSEKLGMPRKDVHIGAFDAAQCEKVIQVVEEGLREGTGLPPVLDGIQDIKDVED